jgi:hypothetical protein
MTDITIPQESTPLSVLDKLAGLPTGPDTWTLEEVSQITSDGDPIPSAVQIEWTLHYDCSRDDEPANPYTAASAYIGPALEATEDGHRISDIHVNVDVLETGTVHWRAGPPTDLAANGGTLSVQTDPTRPFQTRYQATEPTLVEAIETLARLMAVVESELIRPQGDIASPAEGDPA